MISFTRSGSLADVLVVVEPRDAAARPEITQRAVAGFRPDLRHIEGLLELARTAQALEREFAFARATPFAEHDDRTIGQHVGNPGRFHVVDLEALQREARLGQDG